MPSRQIRFNKSVVRLFQLALFFQALVCVTGCTTLDPEKNKLRMKFLPRWETNEVPIEDVHGIEYVGRNFRDGFIGLLDNFFQGLFTVFSIAPTSGYVVQKLSTVMGDIVGLLDDNTLTEHVFKGIISRQFLRFGSTGKDFLTTLSSIHGTTNNGVTITGPEPSVLDYVGDETFHTKVYGKPGAVPVLLAAVASDFIIRPSGNFLLMFSLRKPADKIDDAGMKLIQASTEVPFL